MEMQKKLRTAETIENRKQITECVEMMRQHRYSGFSLFFFFLNLLCNSFLAVLGVRDILVRILIRESVPLTNGSGLGSSDFPRSLCFMLFWFGIEILRLVYKKVAPPLLRVEKKFFEIGRAGYQKKRNFALIPKMCRTLASRSSQRFFSEKRFFCKIFQVPKNSVFL